MKKVKKAIIPVAGFGTRFLPITKTIPQCMLPINGKPIIHYLVEEAVEAGIEEIIFVTTYNKRSVEDYFDRDFELEYLLESKKKKDSLREIQNIAKSAQFFFVRQPYPRGDGFAILQAEKFVKDEPFVILFEDELHVGENGEGSIRQMIKSFEETNQTTVLLKEVPKTDVSKYGIASGNKLSEDLIRIENLEEKPSVKSAKSNLAVIARYICTPDVMTNLREIAKQENIHEEITPRAAFDEMGKGNEIRVIDAFIKMLGKGSAFNGLIWRGDRYDTGDKMGYLKAVVDFSLRNEELGQEFQNFLNQKKIQNEKE